MQISSLKYCRWQVRRCTCYRWRVVQVPCPSPPGHMQGTLVVWYLNRAQGQPAWHAPPQWTGFASPDCHRSWWSCWTSILHSPTTHMTPAESDISMHHNRVPTLLLAKNSRLFQDFPGPPNVSPVLCGSPAMLNYRRTAVTYFLYTVWQYNPLQTVYPKLQRNCSVST